MRKLYIYRNVKDNFEYLFRNDRGDLLASASKKLDMCVDTPIEIGPVFQPKLIWIGLERPIRNAEEVHSVYTFFSCTRCEEEIFSLKQW
ncbi:hypothetical protein ACSQ67_001938 [Phaseolus vulgaris]